MRRLKVFYTTTIALNMEVIFGAQEHLKYFNIVYIDLLFLNMLSCMLKCVIGTKKWVTSLKEMRCH